MLESLAGSKVFSTIDLAASFHQLALAEDAKKYTAFSTLSGHWEFNRVTFGLTNAPPWMQRAISKALTGLEWKICVVWIDDIIIHSKTHEQHIEDLKRVMLALREHGFSVRLSKCHFGMSKVTYLGHSISADGIGTSDDNVKDILACPEPKTVKELQRVLGLFNYYRRFVHQYAQHVKPLSTYLAGSPRGHTPITLTEQARSAFHHLRLALAAAPVLAYPDFSKPFIVEVTALNTTLAGFSRSWGTTARSTLSPTGARRCQNGSRTGRRTSARCSRSSARASSGGATSRSSKSSRRASTSRHSATSSTPRTASLCWRAGSSSWRSSVSNSSINPARSTSTSMPSPRALSTATRTYTAVSHMQSRPRTWCMPVACRCGSQPT